jgi:hypothetical protein
MEQHLHFPLLVQAYIFTFWLFDVSVYLRRYIMYVCTYTQDNGENVFLKTRELTESALCSVSLVQCCPTFLCTRAQFTDAYGGVGATTLVLLLLLPPPPLNTYYYYYY